MEPTTPIVTAMLTLLASDPATLAPLLAADNKMRLITADFTPGRSLVVGDLAFATWAGSAQINVTPGAQQVGYDTLRNQWFIEIVSPVGGWRWESTGAVDPAVNNYGIALVDHTGATVWGTMKFPTPVRVSDIADTVEAGIVRFYESDLLAG